MMQKTLAELLGVQQHVCAGCTLLFSNHSRRDSHNDI
jgi:hypothetical protein